jgi:hypothetical protein
MITQQAASFLIKKMTAATSAKFTAKDRTDELFSWYLRGTRPQAKVVNGATISNEAIVTAFRWRAAELVCLLPRHYGRGGDVLTTCRATRLSKQELFKRGVGPVS